MGLEGGAQPAADPGARADGRSGPPGGRARGGGRCAGDRHRLQLWARRRPVVLRDGLHEGRNLFVDKNGYDVWSGAFSPDGTLLALGDDDGIIHFWTFPLTSTAENGSELQLGTDGDHSVYALTFSPDGAYILAGGGYADTDSNASYWSATARAGSVSISTSHDVHALAYSPTGSAVAGGEINCGMVLMCTN